MPDEKKKTEKGSTISLHHRVKLIGKDGKVKYDSGEKKSDSFVKNFMAAMVHLMTDAHLISNIYTDHAGAARSGTSKTSWGSTNAPYALSGLVNNDNYGIRVGTGNTPVTATDVDLDALIEHGAGLGELAYGAQSWIDFLEVGANVDWVITRAFNNSSGGTIVVAEIGVSGIVYPSWYCQIIRDVLLATVSVGDGEAIIVEYTWRTAVTA